MGAVEPAASLERWLRRCRAGDASGFDAIYRHFGRGLYGTARRLLGRAEDAEDVMQETFLSFYRTLPELPASQLGPWLHRVLVNGCIDRVRRRKRWQEEELSERRDRPLRPRAELAIDLARAVERLPEKARMVFVLHDVEGFKHRELGEMLGISDGTSKSQLSRARQMLRGFVDEPRREERR